MNRLEILQELLKELKLYKEFLLNYKAVNELKEKKTGKVLVRK